jgi:beta-glucosidase
VATFPKNFIWGAATSAFQIEGASIADGRGPTIWDTFCKTPGKVANGDTGEVANDHYNLFKSDIGLMKDLGLKGYRFSFSWSRMFPEGTGRREERGFDFYDRLIDEVLSAGIEPLATLYHWDLPQALQDKGGWGSREILQPFQDYSAAIAERFGDRIKKFTPINEPWVVAWLGHGIGIHAPGIKDRKTAWSVAHHTVMAHALSAQAMRSTRSDLLIGPVLNQANFVVDDQSDSNQVHAANLLDAIQNRFWMDAFFNGKYPEIIMDQFAQELQPAIKDGDLELAKEKSDFLGINYYFDNRVGAPIDGQNPWHTLSSHYGLNIDETPRGELTDMGWPLNPEGIGNLCTRWHKELGDRLPPIFITENGVAYDDDVNSQGTVTDLRRIEYIRTHLLSIASAIEKGAPVGGYYHWSLMDNFEWALGYEKRFGIVHVDFKTQKRTLKDSALWYKEVIANNGIAL